MMAMMDAMENGDKMERVARAICSHGVCLRGRRMGKPCINRDGTNAPCGATRDQLLLSDLWDQAKAAIAAMKPTT
jgi:hypothetical protein